MDEPLNPMSVERMLLRLIERAEKGAEVCAEREQAYYDANRAYEMALDQAFLAEDGPIKEREAKSRVVTNDLREVAEVAKVAHRHSERLHRVVSAAISAYQTISGFVKQAYSAGR